MSDRTIPASRRQREAARRQGHVPRSGSLTSAVVLLMLAVILLTIGDYLAGSLALLLKSGLQTSLPLQVDRTFIVDRIAAATTQILPGVGLFVALLAVAALATDLIQTGFLITFEPLQFQWTRMAPPGSLGGEHLGRRLSGAFGHTVKVALVAGLVAWNLYRHRGTTLAAAESPRIPELLRASLGNSLLQIAFVLLIAGLAGFLLVRHQYERGMRMTPEQAREEQRHAGGAAVPRRRR